MSTPETLQSLVRSLPERGAHPALIELTRDGREDWTFSALAEGAERIAAALHDRGLRAGERVGLYAPSSPPWVLACLGILRAGAVPVPIDSQATAEDLAHILANSGAGLVFTVERLRERIAAAAPGTGLRISLLDGEETAEGPIARLLRGLPPGSRPPGSPSGAGEKAPIAPTDAGTEAVLFYTSGTSGAPKGVPLTHGNILSNVRAILAEGIVGPEDRLLLPLPFHHVYPFALGLVAPLVLGASIILPYSLTGPQLVRALREGEATAILGIPRLYGALYSAIEQRVRSGGPVAAAVFRMLLDLSIGLLRRGGSKLGPAFGRHVFAPLRRRLGPELRLMISGGAALDPELAWRLEGLGFVVATGYGLTETSPILAFNGPGERRFESAGRALPGVSLRIAAPTGEQRDGEVQARGPNVFAGYLDLPERTAEAFAPDGWFRTGDLGYLEGQGTADGEDGGRLFLRGRASARIVLPGGENVDPERMEQRLETCPSVREAGVLEQGGALAAILVPEPEAARAHRGEGLKARLREEMSAAFRDAPSYQKIGRVRIDSAPLPRTRLGKLRRHLLVERFEAIDRTGERTPRAGLAAPEELGPEDRQLLEDPAAGRVWSWLPGRFPDRRIEPDTHLGQDLDVDSLEWVSLTLDLQGRLGLALEEDAIARIETVRDLLRESAAGSAAQAGSGDLVERLRDPESLLDADRRRWLDPPRGAHRILGDLLHGLARGTMDRAFRLHATGLERLPRDGPCILCPNHLSVLDPIVVLAVLDREQRHHTCWGGWTGLLFHRPWTRLASRSLRVLPVDPSRSPLASLALGAAALKRGSMLVWFPEGARSRDGRLKPFRSGVGGLLQAWPVPAIPIWIEGSYQALPPGRLRPRLYPIAIRIGEPADPEALEREGQGGTPAERIASGLQERVRRLGGEDALPSGPPPR